MPDRGRPIVMTEEVLHLLNEGFLNGLTDEQACLYAGISPRTLYNYQSENPDYLHEKEQLKENLKLHAKLNVAFRILNKDLETSKWYLERRAREEFSTRQETEEKSQTIHRVIIEDAGQLPVETTSLSASNTTGSSSI